MKPGPGAWRSAIMLAPLAVVAACGSTAEAPEESAVACTPAPQWLVDAVSEGFTTPGASLADAHIAEATDLSGPPVVEEWTDAQWVMARITGIEEDELGIWVTNRLREDEAGVLLAANRAASEHTDWGADVDVQISGRGTEARSCVGLD